MMIKIITAFTTGVLISGSLFVLQTIVYRSQTETTNLKLEVRITELEQQLEDAVRARPEFTSVPIQANRDALRFPVRADGELPTNALALGDQLNTTTEVTEDFVKLLQSAAVQNDSLNQQLFNDLPTAMEAVQAKALSGNFVGFFEILNNAQIETDVSREYVAAANLAITNLATYAISSDTIADNVKSEIASLESETLAYSNVIINLLDLLDQTLTGNIPSQGLFDEIDAATLQVNEQSRAVIDQYLVVANSVAS